ncbi:unnamed protein product [Oppiella nova]|uniref:GAIN-B domain-containing protein n=1 Tax=Oppiella nova TaxID=334625 RepID=A0A7R9LTX1_9ACAR|nr:unnamed protein product [Oppiella nova]CAG2166964.1 unnamed protein product [Oppiella nova]
MNDISNPDDPVPPEKGNHCGTRVNQQDSDGQLILQGECEPDNRYYCSEVGQPAYEKELCHTCHEAIDNYGYDECHKRYICANNNSALIGQCDPGALYYCEKSDSIATFVHKCSDCIEDVPGKGFCGTGFYQCSEIGQRAVLRNICPDCLPPVTNDTNDEPLIGYDRCYSAGDPNDKLLVGDCKRSGLYRCNMAHQEATLEQMCTYCHQDYDEYQGGDGCYSYPQPTTTTPKPTGPPPVYCNLEGEYNKVYDDYGQITWPIVSNGKYSQVKCPHGDGMMRWLCLGTGKFDETNGFEFEDCWLEEILDNDILHVDHVITTLTTFANNTRTDNGLQSAEGLHKSLSIVGKIVEYLPTDETNMIGDMETADKISRLFVDIFSQMIDQTKAWNNSEGADRVGLSSQILSYIQSTGFLANCHIQGSADSDIPDCVYWNYTQEKWSSEGCQLLEKESNRDHTVCECTHLTNFVALVDTDDREPYQPVLDILRYILGTLSIKSGITQEVIKKQDFFVANLSACQLCTTIVVMSGLDWVDTPIMKIDTMIWLVVVTLVVVLGIYINGVVEALPQHGESPIDVHPGDEKQP